MKLDKKLKPKDKLTKLVVIGLISFLLIQAFIYVIFYYGYQLGRETNPTFLSPIPDHSSMTITFAKVTPDTRTLEQKITNKINELWGAEATLAKAIFMGESHLNPNAVGYNCRYNGKSTWCKSGDEANAWSVDCGLTQKNVLGTSCPAELMDWETNLKVAYELYLHRGFQPWVSYTQKYYLKHLEIASL